MEWTDIRLTVSKADAEAAEAVATMIAEGGIYIEDYSDIEEQVEQIAHVDLIEQELLDKPRDTVIIHMYLEPGDSPVETLALIAANERLYRFEFPERPGALMKFLTSMAPQWNISLFHYRNNGADFGRVLVGVQVPQSDNEAFEAFLKTLGYRFWDETQNPAYKLFLGEFL